MKFPNSLILFLLFFLMFFDCKSPDKSLAVNNMTRGLVDTVGFAQYPWQMDSIMSRIGSEGWNKSGGKTWKLAVCPHDDYTYVGKLYPEILHNIKVPNIILLGVAHRAASLHIEDSLVFESFRYWKGPWKPVIVSPARDQIYSRLAGKYAIKSDTLHKVEHSLESMIPFLQYFNRDISIIPVLIPAMDKNRMDSCGRALAEAVKDVATENNWEWGRDFTIIVTTDAVHYGNVEWGGEDRAPFGCDTSGNRKAIDLEKEIMKNCLTGVISPEKIALFSDYTLKKDNYKEYKWTWCGRYCVPVALYTAYYLNDGKPLESAYSGYSTSITTHHIPVDDILMGRTAIATPCHWVGYAAIGYR